MRVSFSYVVLSLSLLAFSPRTNAQQDFTSNATGFAGTWSSGSGAVLTGPVSLHASAVRGGDRGGLCLRGRKHEWGRAGLGCGCALALSLVTRSHCPDVNRASALLLWGVLSSRRDRMYGTRARTGVEEGPLYDQTAEVSLHEGPAPTYVAGGNSQVLFRGQLRSFYERRAWGGDRGASVRPALAQGSSLRRNGQYIWRRHVSLPGGGCYAPSGVVDPRVDLLRSWRIKRYPRPYHRAPLAVDPR